VSECIFVGLEVLTAVTVKSTGRWDVIPCSPVENLIKIEVKIRIGTIVIKPDVQLSTVVFDVLM
jgi:hypothetical protein